VSLFTTRGLSSSYRIFDYPPNPLEFSCNWFFVFQTLCCSRSPNFSFFTSSHCRIPVIRSSVSGSPVIRCPRNLTITFCLIFRFAIQKMGADCGICVNRLKLCVLWQLLFASDVSVRLHPLFHIFKMNRLLFCYFRFTFKETLFPIFLSP